MDIKALGNKGLEWIKKYRYVVLVVVIGIVLMLLPTNTDRETEDFNPVPTVNYPVYEDLTQELTSILSAMEGVGNVKVMLSISVGEQTIFQEDEDISTTENGSTIKKETVIVTDSDRNQQALISYVKPPTYLGVIIVCQGADQPAVKLAVMDAVSKITGLSSDKISVVKMK